MNLSDNEIIKAWECCNIENKDCAECSLQNKWDCHLILRKNVFDLINRQKAEIEQYKKANILIAEQRDGRDKYIAELEKEVENCKDSLMANAELAKTLIKELKTAKSEAIKEFAEKVHDILMRYAHLHSLAENARLDHIEALDGTKIEMQSVWDAFTLKKNEMAEYEEMGRLQENIETIAKERLFTELEKDFRLLVKEMEGKQNGNAKKIDNNSL